METYFVFDSETGYILSGFDCCSDKHEDGYNVFTRPFKYPEYHSKNVRNRLDEIFNDSVKAGLHSLKKSNLRVAVVDTPFEVKSDFVKNPDYLLSREATRGWWKLRSTDYKTI